MDVYDRIDAILKERHMSRRQLAIAAGIPESSLAAGFSRRSKMPPENLERISSVLLVPPGDLEPRLKLLYEIYEDDRKLVEHYTAQTSLVEYMAVVHTEIKEECLLDRFKTHDKSQQELLYSILACALTLNKDGLKKVHEYMLDISQIMAYQEQGARLVSKKLHKAIQEVTPCPEDAPRTEADCNPGSDPTDAGSVDTRPE